MKKILRSWITPQGYTSFDDKTKRVNRDGQVDRECIGYNNVELFVRRKRRENTHFVLFVRLLLLLFLKPLMPWNLTLVVAARSCRGVKKFIFNFIFSDFFPFFFVFSSARQNLARRWSVLKVVDDEEDKERTAERRKKNVQHFEASGYPISCEPFDPLCSHGPCVSCDTWKTSFVAKTSSVTRAVFFCPRHS